MNIKIENGSIISADADLIVVNLFEDVTEPKGATGIVDDALKGVISEFVIKKENFKGKFANMYVLSTPTYSFSKVLIVGLGKFDKFDINKIRVLSSKVIQKCKTLGNVKKIASIMHGAGIGGFDAKDCAQAIVEGTLIGNYSFDKYKSEKDEDSKIEEFKLIELDKTNFEKAEEGVIKGQIVANAVNLARNLANEPAMEMTPAKLAEYAQNVKNVETVVFDKEQIEAEGMHAFLAVGQGSSEPPKFIHMKYVPQSPKKKIVLIGKGITFDSGGLDLKPPSSMATMKDDMSAAAAVISIMNVLADLKIDIEVHGLIAACENMPSGSSYKPGDVLISKSGKTIEVDNTDAEGRITLADVLTYAQELKPDEIIDIATLTGACLVALGYVASGIMGNNQELIDKLIKSGTKGGERLWQLPLFEEYKDALKSDIADMKNTGSRYGGASMAGLFLKNFVSDNIPWAHIDIAGTAMLDKSIGELPKGPSGVCVRTVLNYFLS